MSDPDLSRVAETVQIVLDLVAALEHHGQVRLSSTDVEGYTGATDTRTKTIYISPGLDPDDVLHVLADGARALAPPPVERPVLRLVRGDR